MAGMSDNSIDLLLTDIPYDEVSRPSNGLRNLDKGDADTLTFDLPTFLNEAVRITAGNIYIWCGQEQISSIKRFFRVEKRLATKVGVWVKTNPSPLNGDKVWLSGIELCAWAKKPRATFNRHCEKAVWQFPTVRSKRHDTEKSLKLFEYLIESSSNPGDLVFDPCIGCGTTAVAARNLGRHYFGSDISEEYCRIARERLTQSGIAGSAPACE